MKGKPAANDLRPGGWMHVRKQLPRVTLLLLSVPSWAGAQADPVHEMLEPTAQEHGVCVASVAGMTRGIAQVANTYRCEAGRPPETPVVFEAASLGKPVFAYGVLKLAGEGKFDLDTPLAEYLPHGYTHVQNPFDDGQPPVTDIVSANALGAVTARHVLTHTSGFPNWAGGPLAAEFEPGSEWRYSGEGYVLLQRVVETITGADLEKFMQSYVFEPLGMSDSGYVWYKRFEPGFARGTSSDGEPVPQEISRSPLSAATMYTTAADYARFLTSVVADGAVMKAIVGAAVEVDQDLGFDWGLGWGLWKGKSDRFIWHWGDNPGFKAFVIASTRTGDGVVILTNSDNGLELAKAIVDVVLPDTDGVFKFYML